MNVADLVDFSAEDGLGLGVECDACGFRRGRRELGVVSESGD